MLVDLVFLLTESADQKRQKNRGENWRNYYDVLVPGMRITSRTLWTTTNIRKAGPAAKGRDNEGQMRRSHVCFFGLVATCDVPGTCPTQKLPPFLNLIQMGPRKTNTWYRISEIPRPGRYGTNIKLKNRKKYDLCICVCQLSTSIHTYHVCHIRAEIPSHS